MHEYENINDGYMVPRGSNGGSKMRIAARARPNRENGLRDMEMGPD